MITYTEIQTLGLAYATDTALKRIQALISAVRNGAADIDDDLMDIASYHTGESLSLDEEQGVQDSLYAFIVRKSGASLNQYGISSGRDTGQILQELKQGFCSIIL